MEKTCQPDLKLHKTLNRVDRWQPLNVDAKALCRHPHNEKKKKKTPIYYIHTQIYLISTLTTFILLFVQLLLDVLHIGARRIKYMSSIFLFITFFSLKLYLYKFYTVYNSIISVENKSKPHINMGIYMKVLKNYGRSNKKKNSTKKILIKFSPFL